METEIRAKLFSNGSQDILFEVNGEIFRVEQATKTDIKPNEVF